eukprot:jgi/Botrbrau1/10764/Bobra.180_2s0029.2
MNTAVSSVRLAEGIVQQDWQPPPVGIPDPRHFNPPHAVQPVQDQDPSPRPVMPALPAFLNGKTTYQPPYLQQQSFVVQPTIPREASAPAKEGRNNGKPRAETVAQRASPAPVRKQAKEKSKAKGEGQTATKGPKKAHRVEEPPTQQPTPAEGTGEEAGAAQPLAPPTTNGKPTNGTPGRPKGSGSAKSKGSTPAPPPAPVPAAASEEEVVEVNFRCANRAGGDVRVKLIKPLQQPPPDTTVLKAHKLASLEGVTFYQAVEVVDPDDTNKVYLFDTSDRVHCPCFNIGGPDHAPIISWSDLHCLYSLPDNTTWAEHGYYHDYEDLEGFAKKKGVDMKTLLPRAAGAQELFKSKGRFHSRCQNIDYECWVNHGSIPDHGETDNMYFWTHVFDPIEMNVTEFK